MWVDEYANKPISKEYNPKCRKLRNLAVTDEVGYKNRIKKRRKANKNPKTHR